MRSLEMMNGLIVYMGLVGDGWGFKEAWLEFW